MKIEWLNDDMTEAIVTVGWLKKRRAHVVRRTEEHWRSKPGSHWWNHKASGRPCEVSSAVESDRRAECERRADAADWQPVAPMPAARTVRQ